MKRHPEVLKRSTMRNFFSVNPWCQGAYARTATGRPCKATSPRARAWDLLGAIDLVARDSEEGERIAFAMFDILYPQPREYDPAESVGAWNDASTRTKDDILELCKQLEDCQGG